MFSLSRLKLLLHKIHYRLWRTVHRGAPFTDYYIATTLRDLRFKPDHPTLGPRLRDKGRGSFGTTGEDRFLKIVRRYDLSPCDKCVDYGCGTLRFGVHAIRYLDEGCYFGLDIADCLIKEGQVLLGVELFQKKQPKLRLICEASVEEAAASKPKLLFSTGVLLHVHPDEMPQYFKNIVAIIGSSGVGIATAKWCDRPTQQIAKQSWLHNVRSLADAAKSVGGHLTFCPYKPETPRGLIEIRGRDLTPSIVWFSSSEWLRAVFSAQEGVLTLLA